MSCLDCPTTAPAWVPSSVLTSANGPGASGSTIPYAPGASSGSSSGSVAATGVMGDRASLVAITSAVCQRIIACEPQLTQYDAVCGDGDCGIVMKKGGLFVLSSMSILEQQPEQVQAGMTATATATATATVDQVPLSSFFDSLADNLSASMGGTSGVLLELFFRAMSGYFHALPVQVPGTGTGGGQGTNAQWISAFRAGVRTNYCHCRVFVCASSAESYGSLSSI
jgi:triose/dihydroxyacetone kinase / FAD-AMP lyase (cyclizing)